MTYSENSGRPLMLGVLSCVWKVHQTLCGDRIGPARSDTYIFLCVMSTFEAVLYKAAYMQEAK